MFLVAFFLAIKKSEDLKQKFTVLQILYNFTAGQNGSPAKNVCMKN
jgi:hypothetical protein